MTDIAYFALGLYKIGRDADGNIINIAPGDLVLSLTNEPGAVSVVAAGRVAPVLVSTLPADLKKQVHDFLKAKDSPPAPVVEEAAPEPAVESKAAHKGSKQT